MKTKDGLSSQSPPENELSPPTNRIISTKTELIPPVNEFCPIEKDSSIIEACVKNKDPKSEIRQEVDSETAKAAENLPGIDEPVFCCQYCEKTFGKQRYLTEHLEVHSGKIYKCKTCIKYLNNRTSIRGHVRSSHKLGMSPESFTLIRPENDPIDEMRKSAMPVIKNLDHTNEMLSLIHI